MGRLLQLAYWNTEEIGWNIGSSKLGYHLLCSTLGHGDWGHKLHRLQVGHLRTLTVLTINYHASLEKVG